MVGIWFAVRFIDWALRSHETWSKARVRTVRNMRFLEGQVHHVVDSGGAEPLRRLIFEVDWAKKQLVLRSRHLKPDERTDTNAFYAVIDNIMSLMPEYDGIAEKGYFDIEKTPELKVLLKGLSSERKTAEDNILKETDEDDGL